MFKIIATMYLTAFTTFAYADKGIVLALPIAGFVLMSLFIGYMVAKEGW